MVRYAANNGRQSGAPWSIRQTAVYEKSDSRASRTYWIFIQPSTTFRSQLKRYMGQHSSTSGVSERYDPATVHLMLFLSTELEWRAYINYLEEQLVALVRLESYSFPLTTPPGEGQRSEKSLFWTPRIRHDLHRTGRESVDMPSGLRLQRRLLCVLSRHAKAPTPSQKAVAMPIDSGSKQGCSGPLQDTYAAMGHKHWNL